MSQTGLLNPSGKRRTNRNDAKEENGCPGDQPVAPVVRRTLTPAFRRLKVAEMPHDGVEPLGLAAPDVPEEGGGPAAPKLLAGHLPELLQFRSKVRIGACAPMYVTRGSPQDNLRDLWSKLAVRADVPELDLPFQPDSRVLVPKPPPCTDRQGRGLVRD
jgi:hypothetical protein